MGQFTLNPASPPELTDAQRARLDSMTDAEIEAGALEDGDNPPLSADELEKIRSSRRVKEVRRLLRMTQSAFAATYHISVSRLRDLEQGRSAADSALLAYLTVIAREPDLVQKALAEAASQPHG